MKATLRILRVLLASLLLVSCTSLNPGSPDFKDTESLTNYLFVYKWVKLAYIFQEHVPADPFVYYTPDDLFNAITVNGQVDHYSLYYPPDEAGVIKAYLSSTGSSGLGIYIQSKDSLRYIRTVIDNSPASRAGLQKHDTLISADGRSLVSAAEDTLYARLHGPSGSTVRLIVKRDSTLHTYDITRGPYVAPTVLVDTLDPNVAYLWITEFATNTTLSSGTPGELNAALVQTNDFPVRVIDLRQNPGGDLYGCLAMTSNFLTPGDTIVRVRERLVLGAEVLQGYTVDGAFTAEASYQVDAHTALADTNARAPKKFVLLVDSNSASASEILTAAILDKRPDIPVMGCNTYGKARGQYFLPTPAGGMARITYAKLSTTAGVDYNDTGLAPTIALTPGTDWLDAAYRRARFNIGMPLPKAPAGSVNSRSRDIELNRRLLGFRTHERLRMLEGNP